MKQVSFPPHGRRYRATALVVFLLTVMAIMATVFTNPITARAVDSDDNISRVTTQPFANDNPHLDHGLLVLENPDHPDWLTWGYCLNKLRRTPYSGEVVNFQVGARPNWKEHLSTFFDERGKQARPGTPGVLDNDSYNAPYGVVFALYQGFPFDGSGKGRELGLTDAEMGFVTQIAVHWWTNYDEHLDWDQANKNIVDNLKNYTGSVDHFNEMVTYLKFLTDQNEWVKHPIPDDIQVIVGEPLTDDLQHQNTEIQNVVAINIQERLLDINKTNSATTSPISDVEFSLTKITDPKHPLVAAYSNDLFGRNEYKYTNVGTSHYSKYVLTTGTNGHIGQVNEGQKTTADEASYAGSPVIISGIYKLEETRQPHGYQPIDPAYVFITPKGEGILIKESPGRNGSWYEQDDRTDITITTENVDGMQKIVLNIANTPIEPEEVTVTFSKVAQGQPDKQLSGATLNVSGTINLTDGTVREVNQTWTTTDTPHTIDLIPGQYTLTETKAPAGYKVANPIHFKISNDSTLHIKQTDDTWTPQNNLTVTMVDQITGPTPITFKKVNDQGAPLSGARFRVTGTRFTGESINDAFTVNGNGVFTWATGGGLYPGTYSIVEETPPGGYARLTQPQAFTVGVDGRLSFPAGSAQGFSLDTTDATGTTMIIKNEKTIPNSGSVRIIKNVAGEFGDKTQDFTFHVTVNPDTTLPVGLPLTWKKYDADGTQLATSTMTVGTDITVTLKHNQYIELNGLGKGLPIGQDRVTVWEDSAPGYVTTVMENGTPHPGPDTDKAYDVVEGQVNSIVFTNTRDITPTGITTSMAGYVIALGLAGAAVLFVAGVSVYRLRRSHA